ncbi:hypothetical protein [Planomonospora sp. ID82291]|uniref:hypothetical protein n=1 Tax=Planomonospora sp. ID82291 TaxID=2738136 RepID=UPI0018C3E8BD|nr:hypothetical protein [Planomonospora sp. ID82291]MBG0818940.1 hypothetical protein [Planomonospora sp. ID82291]
MTTWQTTLSSEQLDELAAQGYTQAACSAPGDPAVLNEVTDIIRKRGSWWAESILRRSLADRKTGRVAAFPPLRDGEMETLILAHQTEAEMERGEQRAREAIAACVARHGGHAWMLECEPEEAPVLSCAHGCPAQAHTLFPEDPTDLMVGDLTADDGTTIHIQGGEHDATCLVQIPVSVEVEDVIYPGGPWGATEYDVFIHLTNRPGEQP